MQNHKPLTSSGHAIVTGPVLVGGKTTPPVSTGNKLDCVTRNPAPNASAPAAPTGHYGVLLAKS